MSIERPGRLDPFFSKEEAPELPGDKYTIDDMEKDLLDKGPEQDVEYQEVVKELAEDVRNYSLKYLQAVIAHERHMAKSQMDDASELSNGMTRLQEVNDNRTRVHNLLIESLEILSRLGRKEGIPTPWWDGPTGMRDLHRSVIGNWGILQADKILSAQEAEERKRKNNEQSDDKAAA